MKSNINSDTSKVFLCKPVHTSNPLKFSTSMPPDALKIHSLTLSLTVSHFCVNICKVVMYFPPKVYIVLNSVLNSATVLNSPFVYEKIKANRN